MSDSLANRDTWRMRRSCQRLQCKRTLFAEMMEGHGEQRTCAADHLKQVTRWGRGGDRAAEIAPRPCQVRAGNQKGAWSGPFAMSAIRSGRAAPSQAWPHAIT